MGLCVRCFSVYSAMFVLCVLFVFFDMNAPLKNRSIIFLYLVIPLLLDGITQYFNLRESNNFLRLLTGFLAGIGISIFFFPIYMMAAGKVTERIFKFVATKGGLNYERKNR